MNISVEKLKNSSCRLDIELPFNRIKIFFEKTLAEIQGKCSIHGFRKGKVPLSIIKDKFSGDIEKRLVDWVLKEFYSDILRDQKLFPVTNPLLEKFSFRDNHPMNLSFRLELYPSVSLQKYKGFSLQKDSDLPTEKDLQNVLDSILKQNSSLVPKKSNTDLTEGDFLQFDYRLMESLKGKIITQEQKVTVALCEGQSKIILSDGQDFVYKDHDPYCDILLVALGMKVHETLSQTIILSNSYPREHYCGKEVLLELTLHGVFEKVIPELNKDFIKKFGEYSIVDEWKVDVKEDMKKKWIENSNKKMEDSLVDQLIKENTFEIPLILWEEEKQFLIEKKRQELLKKKISPNIITRFLNEETATLYALSEKRLKMKFLLDEIAKEENIVASEEDISHALSERADLWKMNQDALKEKLKQQREWDVFKLFVRNDKIMAFLLSESNIVEQAVE